MTLNTGEQRRLMVLNQVGLGLLSSQEASGLLGISERQLRRLRRAYEQQGAKALGTPRKRTGAAAGTIVA